MGWTNGTLWKIYYNFLFFSRFLCSGLLGSGLLGSGLLCSRLLGSGLLYSSRVLCCWLLFGSGLLSSWFLGNRLLYSGFFNNGFLWLFYFYHLELASTLSSLLGSLDDPLGHTSLEGQPDGHHGLGGIHLVVGDNVLEDGRRDHVDVLGVGGRGLGLALLGSHVGGWWLVADSAGCVAASLTPEDIKALESVANGIQLSARIVDTPCNEMHTDKFVEEIKTVAANLGIEADVIRGEELRERGFGGIYGVGKASTHPPALVVLSHKPAGATKTIAWVGKGIVYDTGGLSIKTAMPGMKRDCGGAAAILGAFNTAVEMGFDQNLHALFCLAKNSVGPLATRPDDIHTLYSGKTVEINNTEAEGRLVLSDGVAYAAKDLGADIVLDMCTLTGAQGIATGRYHASHMSNREDWEGLVSVAGRTSGDLSFPAVYCPELQFPEFASSVADMKNSVADRNNAQASCAGLFINANLGFDFPGVWLHVDMAAPAYTGERATGDGVALLSSLFGAHSKSSLFQAASPKCEANGDGDHYDNGETSQKAKKMRVE